MANLYRCLACNLDFEDDRKPTDVPSPRCPTCRRGGMAIAERVLVHFLHPDEHGPIVSGLDLLRYRVACKPDLVALDGMPASNFTPAVTCPRCKEHPRFREYAIQGVVTAGGHTNNGPNVQMTDAGGGNIRIDSPCQ